MFNRRRKQSNSRRRRTLRSALSWTHWSRRRKEQRLRETAMVVRALLTLHQEQTQESQRKILLLALAPLAEALTRQDSLLLDRTDRISNSLNSNQKELLDLMVEMLNSVQPTAEAAIFRQLGQ